MTTTDPTTAEITALREQLAEAREHWRQVADALARAETERDHARQQRNQAVEALVRIAKTLGWDAPPEQVPSGIPDLAIAVQELRRQRDQARTALAEARQQRDQAAEALVRAETERDEALCTITKIAEALGFPGGNLCDAIRALKTERDEAREAQVQHATATAAIEIIDDLRAELGLSPGQLLTEAVTQLRDDLAWLRRQVIAVAEDLERYASDPRPEKLPVSERKLAWTLRQIAGEAPETAPESPQTGEQAQVRGDSRTEASAGADGPWSDAWCRTQLQRLYIAASESGLRWRDYDVVGAVIAEIDRLRTALNSQGGSR